MRIKPLWNVITTKIAANALQKYGRILKWKNANALVMDVGCAEGVLTSKVLYPHVKNRIRKLIAIDMSQEFINQANIENVLLKIDYQLIDVTSAKQIEKFKGMFDKIFSFYVAHWIPDQRTFTRRLGEMLKPGGQIFVTHVVYCPSHHSFYSDFSQENWFKYLPQETVLLHYTDDPTGYIRNIVEEAGFKVELCELDKDTEVVDNCTDLIKALVSLHPYLNRIPSELRQDYYQYHVKCSLTMCRYLREPNVYEWPYEILTCIASK